MEKKRPETPVKWVDRLAWERKYWEQNIPHLAGIDEVGRGCLFGDVVAAAVILPQGQLIHGIDDSKKLSEKKREELYNIIVAEAVAWSVAYVDAATIDKINIKQATRHAMKTAVQGLQVQPKVLLVDAEKIDLPLPQEAIIKGDASSQSIAAASIVAKVTRDRLCKGKWHELYPQYGIATHKGYATKSHREQLLRYGPTPMHRKSFLTSLFPREAQQSKQNTVNRRTRGTEAEKLAITYLEQLDYHIVETNWRCRTGEIDIVAQDGNTWTFIEVRSRSTVGLGYGSAAEAINRRKQQQVRAVAVAYLHLHHLHEVNVRFDAVTVTFPARPADKPDVQLYKAAF